MQEPSYNALWFSSPHVQEHRNGFFSLFSCHWIWYITEMEKPPLHTSGTFLKAAVCTSKTTWHPMRRMPRFTLNGIVEPYVGILQVLFLLMLLLCTDLTQLLLFTEQHFTYTRCRDLYLTWDGLFLENCFLGHKCLRMQQHSWLDNIMIAP